MPQKCHNLLSVSYDESLLKSRQQILETKGYKVTSGCGLRRAVQLCDSDTPFDVVILGHSIPQIEKEALIEHFRAHRPTAQVIALKGIGEEQVRGADLMVEPNAILLLNAVVNLTGKNSDE